MTLKPLARGLGLAMVILAGAAASMPAFAASDLDLLKQYVGDWRGRGTLTGARTETVVCKMTLSEGNQDKVNYNGRCTLAGTVVSMAGTVAYIPQNHRFEAAMTSSMKFAGSAVGQKKGDGIVFNLKDKTQDENGDNLDISATMTLAGGAINVNFKVVFIETGDAIIAQVPFERT